MRNSIVFFLNGQRCEASGAEALWSVSDYLRLRRGLTGTKIVCSEGDCGACTVLVGRRSAGLTSAAGERFDYRPVDACIQFVFQVEGAHVVTVEGLGAGDQLTAVQAAMVDCHGSQCGFCTPGFVVSMTGLLESADPPCDAAAWRTGLTGNLCRCTGYASILEAGAEAVARGLAPLDERYPPGAILRELQPLAGQSIEIIGDAECDGESHRVFCPASLAEALSLLEKHPEAALVAGATDVGVRVNKSHRLPATIVDLNRVAELDFVEVRDGTLVAGARATWTELLETCRTALPEYAEVLEVFGAPQIRHVGTLGGNLANASPIADSLPMLFVLEAEVELASAAGRRRVPINRFYHGYKKTDLRPGELIAAVHIPLPTDGQVVRAYKVSRRRDLDISGFTAAVLMQLDGERIAQARIAMGAVGPTVLRASKTEAFLTGKSLSEATMREAGAIAVTEITPISDVRGGADYRRTLARNVLVKFFHQVRGELASL
jgi:xanthine dehydrogenase small subunit